MKLNKIYHSDCLEGLKKLQDNSIDCCVTSPPYFWLRDYGVEGQIGLEETPELFIQKMVEVFREVRRVLKNEGTLWLNIGDTYWGGKGKSGRFSADEQNDRENSEKSITKSYSQVGGKGKINPKDGKHPFIKPKDLIGIPWMLAFALRADGFYLRQDIIWHKPNPMPESVEDRCTKSHEYIFLFSKSANYYYDAFAIATPYQEKTLTTFGSTPKGQGDGSGLVASENWNNSIAVRKPKVWKVPSGWDTENGAHGSIHKNGRGSSNKNISDKELLGEGKANKRSVWTVATKPFKDAHFATFPQELIIDCIKAGCPIDGVVLDPFMGAGTTALVAAKLNRNYLGFELNQEYIKIAKKRLIEELGLFIKQ